MGLTISRPSRIRRIVPSITYGIGKSAIFKAPIKKKIANKIGHIIGNRVIVSDAVVVYWPSSCVNYVRIITAISGRSDSRIFIIRGGKCSRSVNPKRLVLDFRLRLSKHQSLQNDTVV